MKVLIVDDSILIREMLNDLLVSLGHEPTLTSSAEEACREYSKNTFPLVISDWEMPGMSGPELCSWIRHQSEGELTLMLMITARKKESDLEIILKSGADDYLSKPLNSELLKVRLKIAEKIIQDRVKRKQAETFLKKSKEDLEKMHQELKEKQMQLIQSEKMASLGQIAAGVAHEINNPIGFVCSNLGTLTDYTHIFLNLLNQYKNLFQKIIFQKFEELDKNIINNLLIEIQNIEKKEKLSFLCEDVQSLLIESKEGILRIQKIVQGLKSFARLDEAELKEINLNESLDDVLKILSNEIKYKCELHKNYGKLPPLTCYSGELNQVFMNLILNAAQAIQDHGDISITTQAEENEILIKISDTGKGIPQELISKLFDPFFTTKPVGEGTGLGLAITHGIIRKHQGEIEVESQVGKGTTFTVHLPIH